MELDRQNKPCIIKQCREYEQQRVAECKRYRFRRKAYEELDGAAILWETAVVAVVQAYCDTGGDSKIKEDELHHRLCWFHQLLLDEIKRPHNLKPSHVSHDNARVPYKNQYCPKKLTNDDEMIEEMVWRSERELEEEFAFLRPVPTAATQIAAAPTTAAAKEVPEQSVPPAVGEEMEAASGWHQTMLDAAGWNQSRIEEKKCSSKQSLMRISFYFPPPTNRNGDNNASSRAKGSGTV